MINQEERNKISIANEAETENLFKELGFSLKKLDESSSHSCPNYSETKHPKCLDYLISKNDFRFLCEVKTIFSAGYLNPINIHPVSNQEKKKQIVSFSAGNMKPNSTYELSAANKVRKTCDSLSGAISQYKSTIRLQPEYKSLPFVVAIYYDFFADTFKYMDNEICSYPEISALIKKLDECETNNALEPYSAHDIAVFIKAKELGYNGIEIPDIPKSKPHWHYLINPNANIPLDPHAIGICPFDIRVR